MGKEGGVEWNDYCGAIHLNSLRSKLLVIYPLSISLLLYNTTSIWVREATCPANDIYFQVSLAYEGDDVKILSNEIKMEVIVLGFSESSLKIGKQLACAFHFFLF